MTPTSPTISRLDSTRFGVTVARVDLYQRLGVAATEHFCETNGVDLLIARCPVAELGPARESASLNLRLMDIQVAFGGVFSVPSSNTAAHHEGQIRCSGAGDAVAVESLARRAFDNYGGHYHADDRLDRKACTEVYASWARRCCDGEAAETVLIAEDRGVIAAFVALARHDRETGSVVLIAVDPQFQGQGWFRSLLYATVLWCREEDLPRLRYVTGLSNRVAINSVLGLGLKLEEATAVFHGWPMRHGAR